MRRVLRLIPAHAAGADGMAQVATKRRVHVFDSPDTQCDAGTDRFAHTLTRLQSETAASSEPDSPRQFGDEHVNLALHTPPLRRL